jgi:hypothetical protein
MRCPTKYLRGRISNYNNNNGRTNRWRKIYYSWIYYFISSSGTVGGESEFLGLFDTSGSVRTSNLYLPSVRNFPFSKRSFGKGTKSQTSLRLKGDHNREKWKLWVPIMGDQTREWKNSHWSKIQVWRPNWAWGIKRSRKFWLTSYSTRGAYAFISVWNIWIRWFWYAYSFSSTRLPPPPVNYIFVVRDSGLYFCAA